MFGLSFGRDPGRDFVSFPPVLIVDGGGGGGGGGGRAPVLPPVTPPHPGEGVLSVLEINLGMTAGYWWGHGTTVHAKYTHLTHTHPC